MKKYESFHLLKLTTQETNRHLILAIKSLYFRIFSFYDNVI